MIGYEKEAVVFGSRIFGLWADFLAREVRFVIRETLKPAVIQNAGIKLPANHRLIDHKSRRALYRDNYERPEMIAASTTLRRGDRVLELGAGIGAVSALCGKIIGQEGYLASVEANKALLPLIAETWHMNGVSGTLIHGLVSTTEGTAEMWIAHDLVSSSRVERGIGQKSEVPTVAINRLIEDHNPTVLVADIEGAECDVLAEAELGGVRAVCLEVHPHIVGNNRINALIENLRKRGLDLVIDRSGYRCLVFERPG